ALQVLFLDRGVGRAAAHREVVAADDDRAAIDFPAAEDEIGGRERLQIVGRVVGGLAGDLADLVKRARIDELGDAFADRHAAARVLAFYAPGPAELLRHRFTPPQLVHLRLPGHRADLTISGAGAGGSRCAPATCAPRRGSCSLPTRGP